MSTSEQPFNFSSASEADGQQVTLRAPAKLNLRLKLEGRRSDGYHLLSMLNVLLGLHDEIELTLTSDPTVTLEMCGDPALLGLCGDPQKNLLVRSVQDFFQHFKIPLGAKLCLTKQIPVGAGLGGGSSDAGSTLRFLFSAFLPMLESPKKNRAELLRELNELALNLGADVPFFVRGSFARVTGVGEKIDRFNGRFLDHLPCLVVVPPQPVATAAVYAKLRELTPDLAMKRDLKGEQYGEMLRLNTAADGYEPFRSKTITLSLWRDLLRQVGNDLEPAILQVEPKVGEGLSLLRTLPEGIAGVTGSGSALFFLPKNAEPLPTALRENIAQMLVGYSLIDTFLLASA